MKKDAGRFNIERILLGSLLIAALCCFGCTKPEPSSATPSPQAQTASAPAKPVQQAEPVKQVKLPPPKLNEVEYAIKEAYQNSVTLAASQFFIGDFDGDGSQDIAAVVRPARGMLSQVNSEYARWKLDDPHQVIAPNLYKTAPRPSVKREPVRAKTGDRLLAVIHGEGPYGWRHAGVNNAYLLEHASGGHITVQPLQECFNAAQEKDALPNLRGDVIKERLTGSAGFLYYTGASYAWFDLHGNKAAIARAATRVSHLK
ncbi:MAG: hypothetical protein V7641_1322 [Blastocatellia bacterium]